MTDDKDIRADHPELDEDQRDDPTLTKRITREDVTDPEGKTAVASTPEQASTSGGVFQQMWRRIQEERKRPKRVELKTRGQNNMDRRSERRRSQRRSTEPGRYSRHLAADPNATPETGTARWEELQSVRVEQPAPGERSGA